MNKMDEFNQETVGNIHQRQHGLPIPSAGYPRVWFQIPQPAELEGFPRLERGCRSPNCKEPLHSLNVRESGVQVAMGYELTNGLIFANYNDKTTHFFATTIPSPLIAEIIQVSTLSTSDKGKFLILQFHLFCLQFQYQAIQTLEYVSET